MDIYLAGVVCLVIGLIIGFFVLPLIAPKNHEDQKTADKLKALKQDFNQYQHEVADHLQHSSTLIDSIHQNYLDLQDHLYAGAKTLNRDTAKSSLFEPSHYYTHVQKSIHGLKNKLSPKNTPPAKQRSKKPAKPPIDYDATKHTKKNNHKDKTQ